MKRLATVLLLLAGAALLAWLPGEADVDDPSPQVGSPVQEQAPAVEPAPLEAVEARLELPELGPLIRGPYTAEDLASRVQDVLNEVGDRLRVRDVEGALARFTPEFRGHGLRARASGEARILPASVQEVPIEAAEPQGLDRTAWADDLSEALASLTEITHSECQLLEAEFERDRQADRGRVRLALTLAGREESGSVLARERVFDVLVAGVSGDMRVDRAVLLHGRDLSCARPGFTDVSRSTGVHLEGPRYGQPGNDREGWNGAAAGDVDGDGWLDLFVPGPETSHLYRNDQQGGFEDWSAHSGLAELHGCTGAVLADLDADGDLDLVLAAMGWARRTEQGGSPLRVLANRGDGRFDDVSAHAGLGAPMPAMGVTVADFDGDHHLDLFFAGYGRMEEAPNDNWVEAMNGAQDRLLLGAGDLTFQDVTVDAGLEDHDWTVAALAVDLEEDGDVDLIALNHFGPTRAWRNDGRARFTPAPEALEGLQTRLAFGGVVEDLDGDGALDLYLTGATSGTGRRMVERAQAVGAAGLSSLSDLAGGNRLLLGGQGGFRDVGGRGSGAAGWSWGATAADFDLDGLADLACASGFVTGQIPEDT